MTSLLSPQAALHPMDPREPALPPPQFQIATQLSSPDHKQDEDTMVVEPGSDDGEQEQDNDDDEEEPTGFVYQAPAFVPVIETDPHKLKQRAKQIEFGKNTIGYQNYTNRVPRRSRVPGNKSHPVTPRINKVVSKRNFDGQVRAWRRALHQWDVLPGEETKLEVTPRAPVRRVKQRVSNSVSPIAYKPQEPESAADSAAAAAETTPPTTSPPEKTVFDEYADGEDL
jgi:hypothetical protein